MVNIKKSRTAKVIAGFVGFATAVTMSFGTASAQTAAELQAQIASLLATIQSLQAQLASTQGVTPYGGTTTGGVTYTFATDLKMGSTGTDVMNLQKVLNSNPATKVSETGTGAPGMESTYFGAKTKAAVIKFQTAYGISPAAGYVGPITRAKLNTISIGGTTYVPPTQGGYVPPVAVGNSLNVTLSPDNPASGTFISGAAAANGGQSVADMAHFTFTNTTGSEVKITKLIFNRTGVSNDSTLTNVYLYSGAVRLTDAATVSSAKITVNDPSGIFKIPAGQSKVISVKADIAGGTSGQIVGVALASVEAGGATVNGSFPIAGNQHTIATATMATAKFTSTISAMAPASADVGVDPQTEYVMWSDNVSVGTRAVDFRSIIFRMIGSVANADLANFKLLVDGTQLGQTVANMDANGYVTFDFAGSPKSLGTGSHTVKLIGDIIGGSTKTFNFSLQNAGDAVFVDSQLGVAVPTWSNNATSFSAITPTGNYKVNAGNLTIVKKSDSPSGNITKNASGATLAKFELKATGEPIKVEYMNLAITQTGETAGTFSLRNGAVFADGVQVGNTLAILGTGNGVGYTLFSLGSALVVNPGTPVTLDIRGDVYNEGGAKDLDAGDTIRVDIVAKTNAWKKMQSLAYGSITALSANNLAVAVGSLTGAKNSTYANQSIVVPQTAYKIGSFNVVSTDAESINLSTINIDLDTSSTTLSKITDLYVKYGTKQTSNKSTVASTGNNVFNINETLSPNSNIAFDVYATLASSMGPTDTVVSKLEVSGTTISGTTVSTAAVVGTPDDTGQTITIKTGSIAAAAVTDTSLATKLLVGNSTVKIASFRFTSVNDSYSVKDMTLKVDSANSAGAINYLILKNSGMADKNIVLVGTVATATGLTVNVPANDSAGAVVDVYANLNTVSASAATSSADVKVTLDAYKHVTSGGTEDTNYSDDPAGQSQYVFKSIPTISLVTLPSTLLQDGIKTIFKFQVAADSAGSIGWKKIQFTVSKTATLGITGTTTTTLWNSAGDQILGTFATSTGLATGGSSGTLTFTADSEQQISTSETYSLKTDISNTTTGAKSISTSIANPNTTFVAGQHAQDYTSTAATASFVWTDRSANSHGEGTADWNDDFKVKNLPTDTQTLTGPS